MNFEDKVVYQVYPKSFYDSNNDGIGDLNGITEKLDYIKYLGADYIWITPFFISPQRDNGYDVADYCNIDPAYGTMEDFDRLSAEAKKRGIGIMLDMVFNHTSTEHKWFKKALAGEKKFQDFYIFKKGEKGNPPTNWASKFGGNAWEYVEELESYYLHLFDKTQADLNWENPKVREEVYKNINWWLDKGIAGFRVDAINFIKKDQRYLDGPVDGQDGLSACFAYSRNQPGIEVFFDELKKETFEKHNCMTVAEAVGVQYKDLGIFIGEQGCFSMMFDFNYCNFDISEDEEWFKRQDWTTKQFKELLFTSQREVQKLGWIASFLENHDQPRAIDKFVLDKKEHNYYSQTMLAGMFFNLRGTPFIYQGEEIGMENFERKDISEFDDIGSHGQYQRALEEGFTKEEAMHFLNLRSRDNTRTPMQWDSSEYAGFSNHEPWLKMTGSQDKINVESQFNDPNSIYSFYKKMISIRKQEDILVYGDFEEINTVDDVIGYKRTYQGQEILCFCNFTNKEQQIPKTQGNILLDNYNNYNPTTLKPYQFIMIKK